MKRIVSIVCALGLGIAAHGSALAQDFSLPPIMDGSFSVGLAAQSHIQKSEEQRAQLTAPNRPNAEGFGANLDFDYTPNRARTEQNLRNFIARTPDPAARENLEQMFATQPNIIEDIRAGIRPYGLDSHNTADAYAMWWINAWLASEKRNVDTDRGTVAMVKQQVRSAFAATPDFATTDDAQRQEYAEALLIQGLILAAALDQFDGNPEMLEQLSQAARQGAKASGLDLSLMTLTANGFVPRTGADASDAVEGEAAHALAKDSSSEQGSDSDSSMGIALAAGAGLGLVLLAGGAILRKG